jgi:integrase
MPRPLHQLYTDPEICPKDPTSADMHKPWFVQFRFYDTEKKKWILKTYKKGINYIKKYRDRLSTVNGLKDALLKQLEKGWNPITNTMPVEQIINPLDNSIANLPFSKALTHALNECKVSPGTKKEYRLTVNHLHPILKKVTVPMQEGECHVDFSVIPAGQIKKYHIKLIMEEAFRELKWSNNNWNKHLGNLQCVLARLVDSDVYEHNPAHDIKYLEVVESNKFEPLNETDKKKIRDDIFLHHFGFYVYLMTLYHAGLRPFEALALRIPDVDLERRLIKIIPDPSKNNSKTRNVRPVPLNDDLYVLLKVWIEGSADPNYFLFGSPYGSGKGNRGSAKGGFTGAMHPDYFQPSNTQIKRDTVTRLWKKLLVNKLGVKKYMYALKHTGGDDKIVAGVDLDALRDLYGHQSKRMSERYAKRIKEVYKNEIIKKSPSF